MPPVKGPSDKSSPESSTSDPPKSRKRPGRVPVSCAECRRLKLRCDRKVPCETCVKRGCAALCPDGSLITGGKGTRQAVADVEELKNKIQLLQNRSAALETALRTLQAAVSDSPHPLLNGDGAIASYTPCIPIESPPSAESRSSRSDDSPLPLTVEEEDALDAFGTLTLGARGETRFFGPTSRSEYLIHAPERLTVNEVRFPRLSKEIVDEANKELDVPCRDRELGTSMMQLLPPLSQACQMCETFLEYGKYLWYPLPRKYIFDDIVGKVYQSWKDSNECNIASTHQLALMWIVYALATLMDPNAVPYSVEAHEYYLLSRLSLRYAPPQHDTTVIATQTLVYQAQYLELSDCEPAHTQSHKAWMLIGHAVKLGHSIGLHMSSHRWRLDEDAVANRNRVFWQLFFHDTWLSFGFGRPPSINLAFVDCEMPKDPDGMAIEADKRESGFHQWSWQFTKFFHSIMTTAFGVKSPTYAKVMEMDKRVRDFPVPIPLRVQCGEPEFPPPTMALVMQRMFGTLLKEQTLLNLHRPYFSQALHDMPQDPLRHRYGPSVMAVYRSAWRIFAGARCAHKTFPGVAARLGILWSYTLAGSIVMCLLVIRAPSTNLAQSSLEELDKLCEMFEDASKLSQIASNNLEAIRKLRGQAHDAVNKVHAAEDTARIRSELDRFGGKTHLICPKEDRRHHGACPDGSRTSKDACEPAVQIEMIHPTIVQDMRAFDVGAGGELVRDETAVFNMDFPMTPAFDPTQMDFTFPDFDFSGLVGTPAPGPSPPTAPGSSTDPGLSTHADMWLNGGEHVPGSTAAGMNGMNGANRNGHGVLDPGMGVASGPPVLDATWQALVEQLGF